MIHLQPDAVLVGDRFVPNTGVTFRAGTCSIGIAPAGATVLRLPGRVLMPGFVNSHSHVFQRALRGRVEKAAVGTDFWSWRKAMYQLVDALDPEGVQAIATYAFAEMLKAGYTRVKEFHYLHHAPGGVPYDDVHELAMRLVAAASDVGLALEVVRVAYLNATEPSQRRFADLDVDTAIERTADLAARSNVPVGIAPHSVRACSLDGFERCARWAADANAEVHAHVSEQPGEVRWALETLGGRPLQLLADRGVLSPRFTAVHLTHLDDSEIAACGAAGITACLCPTTEANLGDGVPRTADLLAAGARPAIGSDSQAEIDPFLELRLLEYNERNRLGRRQVLSPGGLLSAVLEPVSAGRWIELDTAHPSLVGVPVDRLADAVVMSGRPDCVAAAWLAGRRVETRLEATPYIETLERLL